MKSASIKPQSLSIIFNFFCNNNASLIVVLK